jgi:hypothetical protein
MTPCASPQSEVTIEYLSKELIVSRGNQNSNSQSSGGRTTIQSQLASPKGVATQNNMEGVENTLKLPEF